MTTAEVLAEQLTRTREWTLGLIDDLDGEDWTFQPAPGVQHALWICGHLACAQELLLFQRCLGRTELQPGFASHFPIGAAVLSAGETDWPTPEVVLRQLDHMQRLTVQTVEKMSDEVLAEPAYGKDGVRHPHYDNKREAIGHLVRHEAFHAGQLAMIRRLLGRNFIR